MKKIMLPLIALATVIGLSIIGGCNKAIGPVHPSKPVTSVSDSITCDSTGAHISDSLWAYYPINGSDSDASGHNHAMTLVSGVSLGTDQFGHANSALDFSGIAGGHAVINDGTLFGPAAFTISLWIDYRKIGGYGITKTDFTNAEGTSISLGMDPRNWIDTLRFSIGTTPNNCTTPQTDGIETKNTAGTDTSTWYHLVATFSAGVGKIYVNGQFKGSVTAPFTTFTWCSNAPFILGNWWSEDDVVPAFNGKMDEIRIYTRALCDLEISYLYHHSFNVNP